MGEESQRYFKSELASALKKSEMQLRSVLKKSSKKSSGIYYTPNFIVYHITKNAISQSLINRANASLGLRKPLKSLNELRKEENKDFAKIIIDKILPSFYICDIAMGWGVFLLHSFDILFNLYEKLLTNHQEIVSNYNLDASGDLLLIKEHIINQIVSNNIYGVDLSEESVNLAKLKVVEKSLQITKQDEIELPTINFSVGNCLTGDIISPSQIKNRNRDSAFIYSKIPNISTKYKQQVKNWLLDQELFHWGETYPCVMKTGGFDVIVGNPPYINVKRLKIEERKFFSKFYQTYNANGDVSNIFWERSINLCKNGGVIAFITPRYWLEGCDSNSLREFILNNSIIKEIIDFRSNRTIFKQTEDILGIDTAITIIQKGKSTQDSFNLHLSKDNSLIKHLDKKRFRHLKVKQSSLAEDRWIFEKPDIISKIEEKAKYLLGDDKKHKRFEGICEIGKGCSTGNNKIFRLTHLSNNVFKGVNNEKLHLQDNEMQTLRLLIKNSDIHRYWWERKNQYWIFLKNRDINDFPNIKSYLEKHRVKLEKSRAKYGLRNYYDYVAYRSLPLIERATKIISPYQATNNKFALVTNQELKTINETDVITIALKNRFANELDLFYLLAVLNSEIMH
ncbi:MAG: N-6 DNA methylase, partial [Asgard group archaeon]|nr:N-6 DNA methylase [Asgard group archaeon]